MVPSVDSVAPAQVIATPPSAISTWPVVSAGEGSLLPPGVQHRYEDLGLVGQGGMGEVRRVMDRALGRILAMKVLHRSWREGEGGQTQFIEEARTTARLQHPGIIPIYDVGTFPDGRVFYTMRLVEGQTLRQVIAEAHHSGRELVLRPLVEAFHKVCEAVAFAHHRGVVHRDLKPSNVMVGEFGEVLVLDWGLAQDWREFPPGSPDGSQHPEMRVAGTPAYMAPEQAAGGEGAISPRADVYALGAILYEILSGRPPYVGTDPRVVLAQLLAGAPPPPVPLVQPGDLTTAVGPGPVSHDALPLPLPFRPLEFMGEVLESTCQKAMARSPEERFPDAAHLAREVAAWLEGAERRRRAGVMLESSRPLLETAIQLRAQADKLRSDAGDQLDRLEPWQGVEVKRPHWEMLEQSDQLEARADRVETTYLQGLQAVLLHDPDLPEAHHLLADYYRRAHERAEQRRDLRASAHLELMIRVHDRGRRHHTYLRGEGQLTLVTDPPARAVLYRLEVKDRRLVPLHSEDLGTTPMMRRSLEMGSWLIKLTARGRSPIHYPVVITRGRDWDGIAPGESTPRVIQLPHQLSHDEVYIPAGWFQRGGDMRVSEPEPLRWCWQDSYYIRRFPVTNGEYLAFVNDRLEKGSEQEALLLAPCERAVNSGSVPTPIYHRDHRGQFVLGPDPDGDVWLPRMPVVHIDFACALAYARWESERTGLPWTLCSANQWEKAARGVDARIFPWGDDFDPTFARVRMSSPGRATIAEVDDFPLDESIYGVRGMGGNVQDWCITPWHQRHQLQDSEPEDLSSPRILRGGAWRGSEGFCRIGERSWTGVLARTASLGFRLVRPG